MRNHVVEQALLNLIEYLEEVKTRRDKCAIIKEFGIASYMIAMACEELEESISDMSSGKPPKERNPLRLWPQAHKYFDKNVDRSLINEIFFNTVTDMMAMEGPEGEQ